MINRGVHQASHVKTQARACLVWILPEKLHMLVYPSGLDLSGSHLLVLTARIRERRRAIGSRWRRLSAGRQALLALAHLRNGHPYAQLAAALGIAIRRQDHLGGVIHAYRHAA
jgi:hypothetical protein